MIKFGEKIVKFRIPILIIGILLLIPSAFGYFHTRINYDILSYLPSDIQTVKGQDILKDDFGKGAFSMVILKGMDDKSVAALEEKFKTIDHVDTVLWYDSLADLSMPKEMLPDEIYKEFNSDDATLMAVFFDTGTSEDATLEAIDKMKTVAGEQCVISGMTIMVSDFKQLCETEEPIYVVIAVVLSCLVMMLFMDSWIIPLIFMLSIGMAIIWNLGSNVFMGEISFITKALAAVLQLAVTMDYSIFLWHSYEEEQNNYPGDKNQAMAKAITHTITSVVGSSITTVAGFLAMCFMTFTLGMDMGIVMAKGVVFGVVGCVTTLPALILTFDTIINKTRHRNLLPDMHKIAHFVTGHYPIFLVIFLIILVPAYFGYQHTGVYYNLGESLPDSTGFVTSTKMLKDDFNDGATHMILASKDLPSKSTEDMLNEIKSVDGVKFALGADSLIGPAVPTDMIPSDLSEKLEGGDYKLLLIQSEYATASDEVNKQIDTINGIIAKYDDKSMLIGEAPCTKDLITITDHDFQVVSIVSIVAIFLIIAIVLKSVSLPFILVAVIEFAIFINLGIPYYLHQTLPFIAPICISTIQLGATVDYAILMTTQYKTERYSGLDKRTSIDNALAFAIPSIIVSACGFFAATIGVAVYSDVDLIGSLCNLMARGAIVSMFSVILVLPSMFMVFDKVICKTSKGFLRKDFTTNEANFNHEQNA